MKALGYPEADDGVGLIRKKRDGAKEKKDTLVDTESHPFSLQLELECVQIKCQAKNINQKKTEQESSEKSFSRFYSSFSRIN